MPELRRVAAIDAGTNTTRLLAAEFAPGGEVVELDRRLIFTRLGQGVDASGQLAPDAIERTVGAIATLVGRCEALGVDAIRIAGTSAVRDAANREALLAAVLAATGWPMEVLPGDDEAALSFAGATADLQPGRYLVFDIGGGSTEFAAGYKDAAGVTLDGGLSLKLGVVRLTERHLHHDPALPEEIAALEADVDATLQAAADAIPDAAGRRLVGVAGTVTSLAAISLGLRQYDPKAVHGTVLARDTAVTLYRELNAMGLPARELLPPLPPGRADVIVAGCAILTRVMTRWSFSDLLVSEKDILNGLVQTLRR